MRAARKSKTQMAKYLARSLFVLFVMTAANGCSEPGSVASADTTPDKQFIFEGVRIEERENTELRWVGLAKRADGDLSHATAKDVLIKHYPSSSSEQQVIDIRSPSAQLNFEEQTGDLDAVRIQIPNKGVIHGRGAHYEGAKGYVTIVGPMEFVGSGLRMTAAAGRIDLNAGTLDVEGPVVGTFESSRVP